ncbi:MAG: hypothetical protein COU09_00185 [Candidatus Harrisonbacteria bacterium CG10_big_fil_rev_8_21_14_0_10_44_23]|uniref:Phosphoribosyltransferase domain-containing protein n=1 Tax=Candidatus Harrisonbacteria bacterium CG10_big_fil_rev_8_21_14_0_10_44_23 TaxID=1974585 RepID=A0A2H0UQV9_9BACT|nr:MAG: hypothetical protein COU09_00185 [Candidatus Harrisonbacteria bacterium CG10_big_fil_rev_8_21_14_0_10_44_23]
MKSWRILFSSLLDLIFPPTCLNCSALLRVEQSFGPICSDCLNQVEINHAFFQSKDLRRVPAGTNPKFQEANYPLLAVSNYHCPTTRKLIKDLKFNGRTTIQPTIKKLLLEYLHFIQLDLSDFIIVPLPLSAKRLRGRGYNQSEIIARSLAEITKLPVSTKLLIRSKHSRPQSELKSKQDRITNIQGAFSVGQVDRPANLLIVDDIFTTGATINEAVKTLNNFGFKKIVALVLAKR